MKTFKVAVFAVLVGIAFGACDSNTYECDTGTCIPRSYRCDGENDCDDQSDEIGCPPCSCKEYTCGNGQCIPANYACDAYVDCSNGEDDLGCGSCGVNQFQCEDKTCISKYDVCDGVYNCQDGTDERGCSNLGTAKRSVNQEVENVKGSAEKVMRRVQAAVTSLREKGVIGKTKRLNKNRRSNDKSVFANTLQEFFEE